tara:strand:- start:754 stop:984 length:231 start_codon:yes stop_codon:yes gene_type:complete
MCAIVAANAKLAGVRPPVVTSTKVVKLPNYHNSIYEALRSADKQPELQKILKVMQKAEWAVSDQVLQALAAKHFGA